VGLLRPPLACLVDFPTRAEESFAGGTEDNINASVHADVSCLSRALYCNGERRSRVDVGGRPNASLSVVSTGDARLLSG
jgi:hypothetical protein